MPSQDRPDVQQVLELMAKEALARATALVNRAALRNAAGDVVSFGRPELIAAIAAEILRAEGVTVEGPIELAPSDTEPEKTA